MNRLDYILASLRRASEIGYPWSVSPDEAGALVAEVERLRALEFDAERALVKAELWNYYEAFVAARAGSITELVVQRDEARAEMDAIHSYLSLVGVDATDHYRHVGVRDSLLPRVRQVVCERDEARAEIAAERAAVVAWLRSRGMADYAQSNLDYAATMIERGEHRREGDK